jgi:uncharacterized protein Usg
MVTILSTPVIVTVNVMYYRPDYRNILQEFLWQVPDVIPELQRVHRFLNFWKENIEAIIHQVEVAVPDRFGRPTWRSIDWSGKLQ